MKRLPLKLLGTGGLIIVAIAVVVWTLLPPSKGSGLTGGSASGYLQQSGMTAGSHRATSASAAAAAPADATNAVTVTGAFGVAPQVSAPTETPGTVLYAKTIIKGTGPALTSSDSFLGNYVAYVWSGTTLKPAQSTFKTGGPSLFSGSMLPGLAVALKGATAGSRVVAVLPPKYGFGPSGNSQLHVSGTDTLVFVIDVLKEFPSAGEANGTYVSNGGGALPTVSGPAAGGGPTVTIPQASPPDALTVTTLLKGSGPKLAKGQTVVVQYTGLIWRTGRTFDSTWSRGKPFAFVLGANPEQVIAGWDKGLLGQTVGSRVLLTVPPGDGYGSPGNAQAGIKGTDTLVFVIDILAAVNP